MRSATDEQDEHGLDAPVATWIRSFAMHAVAFCARGGWVTEVDLAPASPGAGASGGSSSASAAIRSRR